MEFIDKVKEKVQKVKEKIQDILWLWICGLYF